MLIIRLVRAGRSKRAFFDIVVAEKARAVKKKYVEKLGYFDPLLDGGKGKVVVDLEKVVKRINDGAQVSQSAARLLVKNGCKEAGKFIEERVSKPKKEAPKPEPKEEVAPEAPAPEAEAEVPKEEPAAEEAPKEEATEAPVEEKKTDA